MRIGHSGCCRSSTSVIELLHFEVGSINTNGKRKTPYPWFHTVPVPGCVHANTQQLIQYIPKKAVVCRWWLPFETPKRAKGRAGQGQPREVKEETLTRSPLDCWRHPSIHPCHFPAVSFFDSKIFLPPNRLRRPASISLLCSPDFHTSTPAAFLSISNPPRRLLRVVALVIPFCLPN